MVFLSDGEAFVLVKPGDGAFDDPPDLAEPDDAFRTAFQDDRNDALACNASRNFRES